jgi:hypothetical protein
MSIILSIDTISSVDMSPIVLIVVVQQNILRPHRSLSKLGTGGLTMAENKIFYMRHYFGGSLDWNNVEKYDSIEELCNHYIKEHKGLVDRSDLSFHYHTYDDRIDWNEYMLCISRYGDQRFTSPQCVGYFTVKSGSLCREKRKMRAKYKRYKKQKEKGNG